MKLTVFGASGGTGSQVVSQALDAGHEVTAGKAAVVRAGTAGAGPARVRVAPARRVPR